MAKSSEDAARMGKEAFDSGLKSLAAVSKGAQAIAVEASEYMKKGVEDGAAVWQRLLQARSMEKAVEIQSGYVRASYENFVAEMTKLSQLYADLAKDAVKPFEDIVAKTR